MTNNKLKPEDINLLRTIIGVLYDWSGVTDDTPDDTEVISSQNGDSITLGDLRDASSIVESL